ncbi:Mur ligase family protein [Streptomyces lydicus]
MGAWPEGGAHSPSSLFSGPAHIAYARASEDLKRWWAENPRTTLAEYTYLTGMVRPDISLVLNVGSAHAGEFGGREATAKAKGELVEALEPGGTALLNADDPLVAAMASRSKAPVAYFGCSA